MESKLYTKESIDSIINQSIGFEDNVQLILIDNNSFDECEKIALEYINKYPNNVVFLTDKQSENKNYIHYDLESPNKYDLFNLSFNYIEGEFVNFLISYDKLSDNTLKDVYGFFSQHNDEIDIVNFPICKFDDNKTKCSNFNFDKEVIDLNDYPKYSPFNFHSSFFEVDVVRSVYGLESDSGDLNLNVPFNHDSIIFGNNLFSSRLLFEKSKIGLINDSKYYSRKVKRDGIPYDEKSVIDLFEIFLNPLIEDSIAKYGSVPVYFQYMIVMELSKIIKIRDLNEIFSNQDDIDKFWNYLNGVLSHIEHENIIYQLKVDKIYRNFLIFLKNNKEFHVELDPESPKTFLKTGERVINKLHQHRIYFDIVEIKNGFINFTGNLRSSCNHDSLSIEAIRTKKGKKEVFKGILTEYPTTQRKRVRLLGIDWVYNYTFDIKIPLDANENSKINFRAIYRENGEEVIFDNNIKFRKFSGISKYGNYFIKDSHMLLVMGKTFVIVPYSYGRMVKAEMKSILRILRNRKKDFHKAIFYRLARLVMFPSMKDKKVWLFIDREDVADDNAEQLYKYVARQKDDIEKYFVINKDSPDFERLSKITTNVIPYNSFKHKMMVLFSDKIISSQITRHTINPFVKMNNFFYSGTYTYQLCFLQHGVTKDDVSHWFRKFYNNLHLIVAVSDMERDSMLGPNYHYGEEVVQTLGFPRYDYLNNDNIKKQILFVPTWRSSIVDENSLIESEYYARINGFFKNDKLINFLKDNGYEILFKPHPMSRPFIHLLDTENVTITDEPYPKLFNESAMLITDYSSVAFDFAYLKKPVIYYHYGDDYHFEKGYFDYESMGFGPVISDEDELVDRIIDYIENDSNMEEDYKDRVNQFFKYNDKNNCKRNYEWLLKH